MTGDRPTIAWNGDVATVDGADFLLALFRADLTTPERFVIWKDRELLVATLDLVERLQATRIVELGIAQGGSTALLALHARPERLLALDISPDPIVPLEKLVRDRGLTERIHTRYGVDQADPVAMREALRVFDGAPLDLVLDDASHELEATRASFDLLFPHLRPGGVYAIEDWDWGHKDRAIDLARATDSTGWWPAGAPLSILAIEALLATEHPDVIAGVDADHHHVRIVRGPAHLDPTSFRLRDQVSRAARALFNENVDPLNLPLP